jgi:hypothetical protein
MLNVRIKTIPKEKHRYPTLGDYYYEGDQLTVVVSEMANPTNEMLVAIHELVEAYLCEQKGIPFESIDQFDHGFEGEDEPGDDPNAPYYWQHQVASLVERLLTQHVGIPWQEYDAAVSEFCKD